MLSDNVVDLGDGRVAIAEYDDWDRPTVRVLPRFHYDRMESVREERFQRELAQSKAARERQNARRERLRARLSPAAFALWERRQTLDYWLRKTWTSEALERQFLDENPLLDLIDA